jgi:hypothetical protein
MMRRGDLPLYRYAETFSVSSVRDAVKVSVAVCSVIDKLSWHRFDAVHV